jgi:hypothetical protein
MAGDMPCKNMTYKMLLISFLISIAINSIFLRVLT